MHFKIRRLYSGCCLLLICFSAAQPVQAQQKSYWSKDPVIGKTEQRKPDTLPARATPPAIPTPVPVRIKTITPRTEPKIRDVAKEAPRQENTQQDTLKPAAAPVVQVPVPEAAQPADARMANRKWTLQDAIRYAVDNNISIRQNELNARLAALTLKQSRLAQLPSLNLSPTFGLSHGRSIDPTSNQFVEGSYNYISAGGSSDVLVFGWFKQRNTIEQNKLKLSAAEADLDQLKNDVSLNVATGFLRVLMAREQIRVNEKQVSLSEEQLTQTRKFAEAGRLPELNVAQLDAQLASDSSALISAISEYTASILDLKALLNLDFEVPFEAVIPELPMEERIALQTLNPDYIYQEAVRSYAAVRSSDYKVKAADKGIDVSRAALYPQLTLNGQLGTNWTSTYKQLARYENLGVYPNGSYVTVGGEKVDVLQPVQVPVLEHTSLGKQMSNNFRQTISATVNIPIFNSWQSQYAYRQARISYQTEELNRYQTALKLKQDVYKAHNDATNAIQKYYAARRSQESAQRAFEFAEARYKLGLTNTVEYLTTQNTLYKADASALNAKYDLIFKLKVIDYYLGKELKL